MLNKLFFHRRDMARIFSFLLANFIMAILVEVSDANARRDSEYYYHTAQKFIKDRNYRAADQLLSIGVKKHPNKARLYYLRAVVRGDCLGKGLEAIEDYSHVLNLDAKHYPKAYYRRGLLFYNLKQYQFAVIDFSRCLEKIPNYCKVYLFRAKAYAKLGLVDKALKDIRLCVKADARYAQQAHNLREKILSGNKNF